MRRLTTRRFASTWCTFLLAAVVGIALVSFHNFDVELEPHSSVTSTNRMRSFSSRRPDDPTRDAGVPPWCRFPEECRVVSKKGSRAQLAVTPKLTTSSEGKRYWNESLLVTNSKVAYIVEDGCAMGHMLKDIGVVMRSLLLIHGRRATHDPVITFHVVFGNACVTKADVTTLSIHHVSAFVHHQAQEALFQRVMAHWWRALMLWAIKRTPSVRLAFVASDDASEHIFRTSSRHANSSFLLFRRPVTWRWFFSEADADSFRSVLLHDYFGLPRRHAQAANNTMRITIVVRSKNRNFHESAVATTLRRYFSAFHSAGPAVSVSTVDLETLSYHDQVRLISLKTDVLIAAHGAALASLVMLPRTQQHSVAAVVELFPCGFGYWLYEELAMASGVPYFAFRGRRTAGACASKNYLLCGAPWPNDEKYDTVRSPARAEWSQLVQKL